MPSSLETATCFVGSGPEAVRTTDDHAVLHSQLHEYIAQGKNLGREFLARYHHLAVLVAALLFVGKLVFELQGASIRPEHLLGQKI